MKLKTSTKTENILAMLKFQANKTAGTTKVVSTENSQITDTGDISFGIDLPDGFGNNPGGFIGTSQFSFYANENSYIQWDGTKLLVEATNFTLDELGNITASNVDLTGSITATYGSIGGWTIEVDALHDSTGAVGMSSAVALSPTDDIRFWAGNVTPASAPFRVTKGGVITATSGSIGGWDLSSTRFSKTDGVNTSFIDSSVPSIGLGTVTGFFQGTGFWVGKDVDTVYKLHIGNPAGQNLYWNGTTLSFTGSLGTGGTTADTWTINSDLTDANVDLIFGRTTGGSATMRWQGTTFSLDKPLAMGTNKITGLGAPSGAGDAIRATTKITEVNLESAIDLKHDAVTLASPNSGLSLSTQVLALGTPSTLTSTTSNAVSTSTHTHAITAGLGLIGTGTMQYQVPVTGATPFVPVWSGFLLDGTTGGKTVFSVSNTKILTLLATDTYTLTIPATGTAALLATANLFTAKQTITLTTEQQRWAYDANNYAHFTVSSAGMLTITTNDGSASSGNIVLIPDGKVGIGTDTPDTKLDVLATTTQLRLTYTDNSVYSDFTVGSGGDMTIAPTGDLIFNPTGNDVLPTTGYDLNLGSLSKKYLGLYAAELWVETLVAQDTIGTIGGRILVGPTTQLTADITAIATTISVKHNEMTTGDRAYFEANGAVEFISIDSTPSGGGPYTYTVTRNLDGSGANAWSAGDALFNTGTTADGFIDLYSYRSVKSATQYGPAMVGNIRNSATWNDWTEHWAIGNLNGVYGYGVTTYGAAFGKYGAANYLTIDTTNGIRFFDSTNASLAQLSSTTWTIGKTANDTSRVVITPGDISLISKIGAVDNTRIYLKNDGSGWLANTAIAWDTAGNMTLSGAVVIGNGNGFVTTALLHSPFDGTSPYETDYQVDTTGHLGQKATVTGGIIGRPGKFNKAVQIAEATTNLCSNPSFGTNLTLWSKDDNTTLTRVTDYAFIGDYSMKSVTTAPGGYVYISPAQYVAGTTYRLSFYVRKANGSAITSADISGAFIENTDVGGVSFVNLGNGWYRAISATRVAVATAPNNFGWYPTSGATLYYDAVQLEAKAYATPYCDGSLGDGHVWTGTAHASTSTRAASSLSYPTTGNINNAAWSISTWIYRDDWLTYGTGYTLFGVGSIGLNGGIEAIRNLDDKWYFTSYIDSVWKTPVSGATWTPAAGWHNFIYTYDGTTEKVYKDGVLWGSSTSGTIPPPYVPYGYSSAGVLNGLMDDFTIVDHAFTANEAATIYGSGLPLTVPTNKFELMLTGQGKGKVFGHAGGLYAQKPDNSAVFALINEDSVSWGGTTLNTGDFMLGASLSGNSLLWDASAATLTIKGTVTATLGAIGGWTIGTTALTSGTGATSVGLDSGGSNPAIYAGSATPASAPFRVTQGGALTATSATITGSITATSGAIGGWTIGATSLTSGTGANTVGIDSGGVNPAFYAGSATPASAPFRVTQAGALTSTSGAIGGWTIGATSLSGTGVNLISGASAGLAFGATPPTSAIAGTGIWLDKTGLYGLGANNQQFYLQATDGKGVFAGGSGIIDSSGVNLNGIRYALRHYATDINGNNPRYGSFQMEYQDGKTLPSLCIEYRDATANTELITNGGFETGDLTNWTTLSGSPTVISPGYAGTYCVELQGSVQIYENIAVTALSYYLISLAAKACSAGVTIVLLAWKTVGGTVISYDNVSSTNNSWGQYSATYKAPLAATQVDIRLNGGTSSGVYTNLDSISFQQTNSIRKLFFDPDLTYQDMVSTRKVVAGLKEILKPIVCTATALGTATGNCTNGVHSVVYTFVDGDGESEVSPPPTGGPVTVDAAHKQINIDLQIGPWGTTARKVYMTTAGGTDYLYAGIVNNNTGNYLEINIADANLGDGVPNINTTGSRPLFPRNATLMVKEFRMYNAAKTEIPITITDNGSQVEWGFYSNVAVASCNDKDRYISSVYLDAGTYSVVWHGVRSTSCAKIDLYIDEVSAGFGGNDTYAAAATYDEEFTSNSITFVGSGYHLVEWRVNGKHASSSDYRVLMTYTSFKRSNFY